jgi:hypothetical protein
VRGDKVVRPVDYIQQLRGIVRIDLNEALSWLGHGDMLGVHALFPPPYYDHGYEILLNAQFNPTKDIGAIAHVGS